MWLLCSMCMKYNSIFIFSILQAKGLFTALVLLYCDGHITVVHKTS